MSIMLKRRNGETTPYRNSEYIPLFYAIPCEVLENCGEVFLQIPRKPYFLFHDWKVIELIESDLFANLIIDATAFMVWNFMGLHAGRESYSGYEPSWRYAHAPQYWATVLTEENIILPINKLMQLCHIDRYFEYQYISLDEAEVYLKYIVPLTMERYGMNAVIEVAKEFRCFEDFDYRDSRQKIDFHRKWYHTRTQHPQISLDAYKETYAEYNDGREWDIIDENFDLEDNTTSQILIEQFLSTLSEKDRQILVLRMEGRTYEDIAQQLEYKNHSGVQKRIKKIGLAYEQYIGVDYYFGEM